MPTDPASEPQVFIGAMPAKGQGSLAARILRNLSPEDLAVQAASDLGSKPQPLKRLRDRHHRVAELLASGMIPQDVSRVTGMCLSRISILQQDPAFAELLAFYRQAHIKARVDKVERMGVLALTAVEVLQERLETEPEELATKDLVAIASFGMDRTGHGPSSTTKLLAAVMTATDLDQMKRDALDHGVQIITPQDRETRARLANSGGSQLLQEQSGPKPEVGGEEGPELREEGPQGTKAA